MSNPSTVYCPENTWKRVATSTRLGSVKRLSRKPNLYIETYRLTGQSSPTSALEGREIFLIDNFEPIESDDPIDVYIMAIGARGRVRVDLK